jgi:hypothetical protein
MPSVWGKVLKKNTKKLKRKFYRGGSFFLAIVGQAPLPEASAPTSRLFSNPYHTCPFYLLHCSWLI